MVVAVQETIRNPEGQSDAVTQPLNLPTGVSNLAVSGGCANVPEPELALLLVGLLLFLTARGLYRRLCLTAGTGRRPYASTI